MDQPFCRRCVSTGRKCDGYMQEPSSTTAPAGNGAFCGRGVLLQSQQLPEVSQHRPRYIVSSLGCPLRLPSAEAEEYSALSFFDVKTLPGLNGCRKSPSWTRTLAYFANTVSCVHHAAVAVGALHRAYISPKGTGALNGRDRGGNVSNFALQHYNLAISHLLKSSGRSNNAPRDAAVTLLVCYLFTCFDNLAGNHTQAFGHLRSGITLLNESWQELKKTRQETQLSSDDQALLKEITEQFRHLDAQAASFLLGWSVKIEDEANEIKKPQCRIGPVDIRLSSLSEAAGQLAGLIPKVTELRHWEIETISKNHVGTKEDATDVAALRQFLRRQAELVCQLEEWYIAFSMLLPSDPEKMCGWDGHLARMLQLHYMITSALLNVPAGLGEMACDGSLPKFKKIVALASTIADKCSAVLESCVQKESNREPSFTPEMVLIPVLYLIGTKCRDPLLRREIISILRRNPRREGVWDSLTAARVLEGVMHIEEGPDVTDFELGLKTMADIPLHRRISEIHWGPYNGQFGSENSRMTVWYELCPTGAEKDGAQSLHVPKHGIALENCGLSTVFCPVNTG
ncbi:hypothetical protein F4818DRAFT_416411 [Hypoxylon cercidicola]|nr:hypothetical protein F4818DRAFT_416411 [Hypoxylon cercidicola]